MTTHSWKNPPIPQHTRALTLDQLALASHAAMIELASLHPSDFYRLFVEQSERVQKALVIDRANGWGRKDGRGQAGRVA